MIKLIKAVKMDGKGMGKSVSLYVEMEFLPTTLTNENMIFAAIGLTAKRKKYHVLTNFTHEEINQACGDYKRLDWDNAKYAAYENQKE